MQPRIPVRAFLSGLLQTLKSLIRLAEARLHHPDVIGGNELLWRWPEHAIQDLLRFRAVSAGGVCETDRRFDFPEGESCQTPRRLEFSESLRPFPIASVDPAENLVGE